MMSVSATNTLVLSKSYFPQRVIDRYKALCMIFGNRVYSVLSSTDELLGTIPYDKLKEFKCVAKAYNRHYGDELGDLHIYSPSVILSNSRLHDMRREVSFTRAHVYKRDSYTCQYCGRLRSFHDLNYDHVVPRSRGGKTTWENIVTSCYSCNAKKGGRTPEQAGMVLIKKPARPSWQDIIHHDILSEMIDESWIPYIAHMV